MNSDKQKGFRTSDGTAWWLKDQACVRVRVIVRAGNLARVTFKVRFGIRFTLRVSVRVGVRDRDNVSVRVRVRKKGFRTSDGTAWWLKDSVHAHTHTHTHTRTHTCTHAHIYAHTRT